MGANEAAALINVAACVLIFVQYVLGKAVNVFVVLPARHPGANAGNYFGGAASGLSWVISSGPGWAAAHASFGLALVVAAIAAVVLALGHGRAAVSLPATCTAGSDGHHGRSAPADPQPGDHARPLSPPNACISPHSPVFLATVTTDPGRVHARDCPHLNANGCDQHARCTWVPATASTVAVCGHLAASAPRTPSSAASGGYVRPHR